MKLAQVNLTRGYLIPGLGNVIELKDIEAEMTDHGIVVLTATARVLIPWGLVAPTVLAWNQESVGKLSPEALDAAEKMGPGKFVDLLSNSVAALQKNPPLTMEEFEATEAGKASAKQWTDNRAAVAQSAQAQGVASQATPLTPQQQLDNNKAAAAQARAVPQPPPPTKKGGRR